MLLLDRLSKAKTINKIMTIPDTSENNKLEILLRKKYEVFRGSEKNVLKRYFNCAKKYSVKDILESLLTARLLILD